MTRILLVEDDLSLRKVLALILKKQGYEVTECENQTQALERIQTDSDFALALIDMRIPSKKAEEDPEGGLEVIKAVKTHNPNVECIVMTAYGSIPNVVKAMQLGASNYLVKQDVSNELILQIVRQALENRNLRQDNRRLQEEVQRPYGVESIVGQSQKIKEVLQRVKQIIAASTDEPVLIRGGTGTGKDLIANVIHYNSDRKNKPFRDFYCGTLPDTLIQAALFGSVKGAFQDAPDQKGEFEEVDGGTILLNEIGDVSPTTQFALLQVIDKREFQRLGSRKMIPLKARVITATNKDLEQAVETGEFRRDLFYRLDRLSVYIPPLREHKEDIPLLANHFLKKFTHNQEINFSEKAMNTLIQYDWPGNVRELENVIDRTLIFLNNRTYILPEDLQMPSSRPSRFTGGISQSTPSPDNLLEAWYDLIKSKADSSQQINYDHFKRYAVIRTIAEETQKHRPTQALNLAEIGRLAGILGSNITTRIQEVIQGIASEIEVDDNIEELKEKLRKGEANDFVNRALEYYENKLS